MERFSFASGVAFVPRRDLLDGGTATRPPALQHFARGWGGDGWIPTPRVGRQCASLASMRICETWSTFGQLYEPT